MAQRRKDYRFERGDRVIFQLFGAVSLSRKPGVITDVAARGKVGENWDYKVLLDDTTWHADNETGEVLVFESELIPETPEEP